MRSAPRAVSTAVAAVLLLLGTVAPAWAEQMTLTFVRHAQSEANAANVLNTEVPGPDITALGVQQALDLATRLGGGDYDGVYASTMVRSQQTATPLATALGESVVVLPGLQEIAGGVFEGQAERGLLTLLGYGGPPLAWTFGLRSIPIIGSSDTGNSFDARVDGAVRDIYDSGDRDPVIVAHGGTIMFWVMMNVDNPDPLLILTHPLDNAREVVVVGDPDVGWTLTNWGGMAVDPNPSLLTRVFVVVRDVLAALQGGNRASPAPTGVTAQTMSVEEPAAQANPVETPPQPVHRLSVVEREDRRSTGGDDEAGVEAGIESPSVGTAPVDTDTGPVSVSVSVSPNGATDLSKGNKSTPGATHAVKDDEATEVSPGSDVSEVSVVPDGPAPEVEPSGAGTESAPEPADASTGADATPAAA